MRESVLFMLITIMFLTAFALKLGAEEDGPLNFVAHLSGIEGVETEAQGQAIFRHSEGGSELYYRLVVANIEDVKSAHIHMMEHTVATLYEDSDPATEDGRTDGVLAEGIIADDDIAECPHTHDGHDGQTPLEHLLRCIEHGHIYVTIHTRIYPDGEISGQVK